MNKDKPRDVNYGNFEANKDFLSRCGLLTKDWQILEIGSGKGAMVNYLRHQGYRVIGTELNRDYIRESDRLHGELGLQQMSGDDIAFADNSFDAVLSFDVLEHIPDTDKHLQEVKRVLRPGGYYLLQTPNKITNIPWEVMRTRSLGYREYHCSLHTRGQLVKRFHQHGFSIDFIDIPVKNSFTEYKVKREFGPVGLFLFNIFNPDRMPRFLKTNFYVVTRKLV